MDLIPLRAFDRRLYFKASSAVYGLQEQRKGIQDGNNLVQTRD